MRCVSDLPDLWPGGGAQTGKSITPQNAAILITLAKAL